MENAREDDRKERTLGGDYGAHFERALLYALLTDAPFASTGMAALDATMFATDAHTLVWDTMDTLLRSQGVMPSLASVHSELHSEYTRTHEKTPRHETLRQALRTLATLRKRPPTKNDLAYVRDRFAKFVLRSNVVSALSEAIDLAERGDYDAIPRRVQRAYEATEASTRVDLGLDFLDVRAKSRAYAGRKRAARNAPLNVPTLDRAMRGGLEPGALGLFCAPPTRGKTRALVQAGVASLLRGMHVVHVSLELSRVDVALRYEAHVTGVPINTLALRYRKHGREIVRATKRLASLGGSLHIEHWPSGDATLRDVESYLALLRDKRGVTCDVLLIDYLALLRMTSNGGERWERHGDVVREARRLAGRANVCLWSANQTPKDSFNTPILKLSDVSDTVENARVADVMIGLCQTPREKDRKRMRLALLKNRLGGHEGLVVDCFVTDDTQTTRENRQQSQALRAYRDM